MVRLRVLLVGLVSDRAHHAWAIHAAQIADCPQDNPRGHLGSIVVAINSAAWYGLDSTVAAESRR
jgi:hypothetical protein